MVYPCLKNKLKDSFESRKILGFIFVHLDRVKEIFFNFDFSLECNLAFKRILLSQIQAIFEFNSSNTLMVEKISKRNLG